VALDFPQSPAVGQSYTYGGKTWQWSGSIWAPVTTPAVSPWDNLKVPAIASGALTIDLSSPAGFRVTLNQNVTSLNFANVPTGRVVVFTITWVQDATGGRTVAFPASVRADGGGAPAQPATGANAATVQSFYTDDGGATVWQASDSVIPLCQMGLSNAVSVPSGVAMKVPLDVAVMDTSGWADTLGKRIVPKRPGRYLIVGAVAFAMNGTRASGKRTIPQIFKNGILISATNFSTHDNFTNTNQITCIASANGSTDYFELYGRQDTGDANVSFSSGTGNCDLTVVRLGDI
jgi:hypothetical protein